MWSNTSERHTNLCAYRTPGRRKAQILYAMITKITMLIKAVLQTPSSWHYWTADTRTSVNVIPPVQEGFVQLPRLGSGEVCLYSAYTLAAQLGHPLQERQEGFIEQPLPLLLPPAVTWIINGSCHGNGALKGQEHCSLHCQQAGDDSWGQERHFSPADPPMLSLMSWSSSTAEVVTVCRRRWRWGILHPSSNAVGRRICQKPIVLSTKQTAGRALLSHIKRKTVRKLKIPYYLSYLNSSILALTFFTSKCSNLSWSQNVKHPEISISKKQLPGTIFHFVQLKPM